MGSSNGYENCLLKEDFFPFLHHQTLALSHIFMLFQAKRNKKGTRIFLHSVSVRFASGHLKFIDCTRKKSEFFFISSNDMHT